MAEDGPPLDVGCGALVGLRRQQAARCTLLVLGPPHLVSRACIPTPTVVDGRTLRAVMDEQVQCHHRRFKSNVASQALTNTIWPLICSQWCIFQSCIRLACCIHAAMAFLSRRILGLCRPGLVVPTRFRSNHQGDTGEHDAVGVPKRSLGICRESPWLLLSSAMMALLFRAPSLRPCAGTATLVTPSVSACAGPNTQRPTNQPLQPSTCASIREFLMLE